MTNPRYMKPYLFFYRRFFRYCLLAFFVIVALASFVHAVPSDNTFDAGKCAGADVASNMLFDSTTNTFEYPSTNSYLETCANKIASQFKNTLPTATPAKRSISIGNVPSITEGLTTAARSASDAEGTILVAAKNFGKKVGQNCDREIDTDATNDEASKFMNLCDEIRKWGSLDIRPAPKSTAGTGERSSGTDTPEIKRCNDKTNYLYCLKVLWDPKQSKNYTAAESILTSAHEELLKPHIVACRATRNADSPECKALCAAGGCEDSATVAAASVPPPGGQAPAETPSQGSGETAGTDPGDSTGTTDGGAQDPAKTLEDVANNVGQKMFGGGMGSTPLTNNTFDANTKSPRGNSKMNINASALEPKSDASDSRLEGYRATGKNLLANMPMGKRGTPGGLPKSGGGGAGGGAGGGMGAGGRGGMMGGMMGNNMGGGASAAKRPMGGGGGRPPDKPEIGGQQFMETASGKSSGSEGAEVLDKRIRDKIAENRDNEPIDKDRVNAAYRNGMSRAGAVAEKEFFPATFFPQVDVNFREFEERRDILSQDGQSY